MHASPNAGVGLQMSGPRKINLAVDQTPGPTLSPRIGRTLLPQNNTGVGLTMTSKRPSAKKQLNDKFYDLDSERLKREKILNERMSNRYSAWGSKKFERYPKNWATGGRGEGATSEARMCRPTK